MPQGPYLPEGFRLNTPENRWVNTPAAMDQAGEEEQILEGIVTRCDCAHNLVVDCNGITGLIPRSEAALGLSSGRTREIALLSRVGKPVCFQVIGEGDGQYLFSRAKVQQKALNYLMEHLLPGDVISARVTHLEPFGAFVDIGCGLTSLVGIEHISVSRIAHPAERFYPGQWIHVAVRGVDPSLGRVHLTHRELLGTWLENARRFSPGETVSGVVRGNEDYGVFVELSPNLSGLAERKEGVASGDGVSVYIKSILPEKMKVKLILIDKLESAPSTLIRPEDYQITQGRLQHFLYSPPGKEGHLTETVFY
ncbi:S1 RNA-binding domain-containing protein [Intestinimonas butyriciproducens]|uniref:S1 RNA-binding domain-containing protein n=1 Tax=Intestinimonas butyriciproducens TaxID=1297617 RepID=UPI0019590101|nr:S1 RNA-binding domain-containing protein [Intestinimonas butyriciproducens]MBM6917927.1 30S ribosomal protein S1 [Intestinimonas butyriciproducens]